MKLIKSLLSLCVVLMVAAGAWGQVTGITAPTVPAGTHCVGSTIIPTSSAPTISGSPSVACLAEAVLLQLIDPMGNELAVGAAGSVAAPAVGSVVVPAAAAGLSQVYYRYVIKGGGVGCAFNGTGTPFPGNMVGIVLTAPTLTAPIPTICDSETQLTEAQLEINGTFASCAVGTLNVISVAGTAPWNTAAQSPYTVTFRCDDGACNSPTTTTTFVVNPKPVAPTLGSSNIPAICNGATQLTIAQLEVNGTYAACAPGSTLTVLNGAPSNTASGSVVYACVSGSTTPACTSATLSVPYTVNLVVPGPSAVTLSTDEGGASGNGTETVSVCSSASPTPGTLTFGGNCGTNNFIIKNSGGTIIGTNVATLPAPAASTTYTIVCKDALGCESPTTVLLTYNVSTLGAPTLVAPIPTICEGTTQLTIAQLEVNGTYANCTVGTLKVASILGTSPWNTAAQSPYTVDFRCELGVDCFSANTTTTFVVNPKPVAPTLGSSNIPAICNGGTQLTIAQLEVNGTYAACAPGSTLTVQNGVPSNTASGSVVYACVSGTTPACTSATLSVPYTVNLVVAAPSGATLTSDRAGAVGNGTATVTVCSSSSPNPGSLYFGGNCGANNYIIKNSGGTIVGTNVSTITPAPTSSTTYTIVCKDNLGCESTTGVLLTYNIGSTAAPTLVAPIPSICHLATQLTIAQMEVNGVYANCTAGTLKVASIAGMPPYNTAGTYTVNFICQESVDCFSPSASTTFLVKSPLASPTVLSVSPGTICSGTGVDFSVTHSCGSTATIEIYRGATLVASQLAGAALPTVITVNAAAAGTYTAKCMLDGCYSGDSPSQTVTVNPIPDMPTFNAVSGALIPSSICLSNPSVPLQNTLSCSVNTQVLIWYTVPVAGTPISTPNVTPTATTTYYVACKIESSGCEGPRLAVTFTAYPAGAAPTGVVLTADGTTVNVGQNKVICDLPGDAITITGCGAETTLYSVDGGAYSATAPTQMVDGLAHNYRIRCQAGSGPSACNGPESGVMTLTIFAQPTTAPVANLSPSVVCSSAPSVPFGGSSNCGVLATVWFDASTNAQLLSLPAGTPTTPGTYSYYAKCLNAGGCLSPASATVTLTVVGNSVAPVITSAGGDEVCTGINVSLSTNCPIGSSIVWSTGFTGSTLDLVSNVPQVRAVTAKCVTTVGSVTCESPSSVVKTIIWKAFDLTIINIGSSQSGTKPGANVPKSAWAANFVTGDAGPSLQSSSQSNPTVYYTENPNKGGPRFWTIHVEACALPTTGSISYDMLATPEVGVPMSFNTVENNAPYLMYANRDNFTELYAQNNPFFGFFADNGSGGNKYDTGLPKGLYKLSIRYWDQKGLGIAPAVRVPQGNQLQYQEYWFRIQSQNGIGSGAAREGVSETSEVEFATVAPNPVTRTLTLAINGAKGQEVKMNLVDAAGRIIKSSTVTPETNTHREEVDMSSQTTGMYFMNISTPTKRANLKVLKVSND